MDGACCAGCVSLLHVTPLANMQAGSVVGTRDASVPACEPITGLAGQAAEPKGTTLGDVPRIKRGRWGVALYARNCSLKRRAVPDGFTRVYHI